MQYQYKPQGQYNYTTKPPTQVVYNQPSVRVRNINYSPQQQYESYNDDNSSSRVAQFNQSSQLNNSYSQQRGINSSFQNDSRYYPNSSSTQGQQYINHNGVTLLKNPSNLPSYVNSREIPPQYGTSSQSNRPGQVENTRMPSYNLSSHSSSSNPNNSQLYSKSINPLIQSSMPYSNSSSTASSNKNSLTTSNSSSNGYERTNVPNRNYQDNCYYQQPQSSVGPYSYQQSNSGTSSSVIGGYTSSALSQNSGKKVQNRKCGLMNIGNTCYMNSALQCVFNIPGFIDYFVSGKYRKEINTAANKGIADEFADLVKRIESTASKHSAERPSGLKRAIERVNQQFLGSGQQDSQEFLRSLLDGLHNDLNRVVGKKPYRELEANKRQKPIDKIGEEWFQYYLDRDNSVVTDFFTGQLLSKVMCQVCQSDSLAFDNFMDLSLSFTQSFRILTQNDLDRLMQAFLKEETLDDTYYCKICKKHTKSKRQLFIWRLPDILVIHLKRFHFGTQRREKINLNISFPIKDLNMGKYLERQKNQEVLYDLIGVVNHSGSLYGGHYTAQCRNPHDGTWNEFNDSSWNEININQQEYDRGGSTEPYLLFYCKKSLLQQYQSIK